MIVVVDERHAVAEGFVALFKREGVAASGIAAADVAEWLTATSSADLAAVEAFLVGESSSRAQLCLMICARTRAAVIATREATGSLEETLELFSAGVDDVVRKPIHVREILARIKAVARRSKTASAPICVGDIKVFEDGRDPVIGDRVLPLPRRERRILEFLMSNSNCRVSKSQIFNAVYGLFNDDIDENVIESHVSKLRKRLRERLGYDPIDSKRFLGYRLVHPGMDEVTSIGHIDDSFTQDECGLMHAET